MDAKRDIRPCFVGDGSPFDFGFCSCDRVRRTCRGYSGVVPVIGATRTLAQRIRIVSVTAIENYGDYKNKR